MCVIIIMIVVEKDYWENKNYVCSSIALFQLMRIEDETHICMLDDEKKGRVFCFIAASTSCIM
jgi:hypothetical protein